jgi:hypothetical protein
VHAFVIRERLKRAPAQMSGSESRCSHDGRISAVDLPQSASSQAAPQTSPVMCDACPRMMAIRAGQNDRVRRNARRDAIRGGADTLPKQALLRSRRLGCQMTSGRGVCFRGACRCEIGGD